MRSHLLESETAIPAMVGEFLHREVTSASVRRADASGGYDAGLWRRLRELGVDAIEDLSGMDEATQRLCHVLVAVEMGRHLAPVPYVEHLIATRLGDRLGVATEWGMRDWIVAVTVDAAIPPGEHEVSPAAGIADHVLQVAEAECGLIDPAERGSRTTFLPNLGALPLACLTPGTRTPTRRVPLLSAVRRAWLIDRVLLPAGTLLGAGERAAELTRDYVRTRVQFGQPLGGFQVVRHRLAQSAIELTSARLLLLRACSYPVENPAAARFAIVAASTCAHAAERSAREMLQLFGGYGYSLEYDAHLFLRFAKSWAVIVGDRVARLSADGSVRRSTAEVVDASWS